MKNKKTQPVRSHPSFVAMVKTLQAKKLLQEKRFVKSSRITLAMFNQYNKYPYLMKELEDAALK